MKNNKKEERKTTELFWVEEFLKTLDVPYSNLVKRERPDFSVVIYNKNIGIEETSFHWDEQEKGGSLHRAEEEQNLKNGKIQGAFIGSPFSSLQKRIAEKIEDAKKYKYSGNELWLLVVLQVGLSCQYAFAPFLNDKNELEKLHKMLMHSTFDKAYLYLRMDRAAIPWEKNRGWDRSVFNEISEKKQQESNDVIQILRQLDKITFGKI